MVIVVIGVLAAIVIPNVSNFKEEGRRTALVSDTRSIQTAVDIYVLKNHGKTPTKEKPSLNNPQTVELFGLTPEYLRSTPESINKAYFWLDGNNVVHSSYVDAPKGVTYENGNLTWNSVSGASSYKTYTYDSQQTSSKAALTQLKLTKTITPLRNNTGVQSFSKPDLKAGEKLYVSAVDHLGFEGIPVSAESQYSGYVKPDADIVLSDIEDSVKKVSVRLPIKNSQQYVVDSSTYRIPSELEVKSTAIAYNSVLNYYLRYLFDGKYTQSGDFGQSDLNPINYWLTSSVGNQFLTFNFYEPKDMSEIKVAPRTRNDHYSDYRVEVSNDNVNWKEVVSWQSGNPPVGTLNVHPMEGEYQYYRFELRRNGSWGVSLAEVEFYEYKNEILPTENVKKSESKVRIVGEQSYSVDDFTYRIPTLVEVKSTARTYDSNYYMSQLFDGKYTMSFNGSLDVKTYWLTSSTGNQFLTFNFFEPKDISRIKVAPRTKADSYSDYRILASNDNAIWTEIVPWQNGNPPIGSLYDHETEGKYQYYRFELQMVGKWGVSLAEVEFYEFIDGSKPIPKMPTLYSNTSHSDYVTISSSGESTWGGVSYNAYKAFDGIVNARSNGWMTNLQANGYLDVNFTNKQTITDIGLYTGPNINTSLESRAKDFSIQYFDEVSNTWKTALDSSLKLISGEQRFTVPSVGEHKKWRLFIKNHHYTSNAYVGIEEWKIY